MSPDVSDPPSPNAGAVKVALDVDDAPFLKEAEKKDAPPPKKTGAPSPPPQPAKKAGPLERIRAFFARLGPSGLPLKLPSGKKRFAVLGGAGFAFLALVGAALHLFVFSGSRPPPADPENRPANVTTVVVPPTPRDDAPAAAKFTYRLDSFMVEKRGLEGELRFLRCGFVLPTDNEALMAEFIAKNIILRDAVYYYLYNKPLTLLVDNTAGEELKQDILNVVNENISTQNVEQIYVEDYAVTVR
jgi:flagellar FliL protein